MSFDVVDVLGVNLRPNIAGDIGVRDGNTIDRPGHLVSAAHIVRFDVFNFEAYLRGEKSNGRWRDWPVWRLITPK